MSGSNLNIEASIITFYFIEFCLLSRFLVCNILERRFQLSIIKSKKNEKGNLTIYNLTIVTMEPLQFVQFQIKMYTKIFVNIFQLQAFKNEKLNLESFTIKIFN